MASAAGDQAPLGWPVAGSDAPAETIHPWIDGARRTDRVTDLAFHRLGQGERTPVVLLHGNPGSGSHMLRLGRALAEERLGAIRYGKERGVPVVFLLVVDAASFGEVEPVLAEAIAAELRWIGRALLELARRRAEDAGVVAETVIREGAALAEIVAFDTGDGEARLLTDITVPVSRRFRKELRERLG